MFKKADASRPSILAAKASEAKQKSQQQGRLAFLKRLAPIPSVSRSSKQSQSSSTSMSSARYTKEKSRAMSVDAANIPSRQAGTPGLGLSRINSVRLSLIASVSRRRTRSSSSAAQEAAVKRQKENSVNLEPIVAQETLPLKTSSTQPYAVCKTPVQTDAHLRDNPSDSCAKTKKRTSFSLGSNIDRGVDRLSYRTGQGVRGESLVLRVQPNTNDTRRFLSPRRRPMSHFVGLATIASTSDDEEEEEEGERRTENRPRPWRQSTDLHQLISRNRQCTISSSAGNSDESSSTSTLSSSNHSSVSSVCTLNQQHVGRKHDPCSGILESNEPTIDSLEPRMRKTVGIKSDHDIDIQQQERSSSPFPFVPQRSLSTLCSSEVMFRPKRPTSRPARARTMIAAKLDTQQKKEAKAMNIWRNTVSQLIMQDENDRRVPDNDNDNNNSSNDYENIPLPPSPLEHTSASLMNSRNAALCKFIIHELYTTEKSYHQLLTLIQTRYMEPMVAAAQATNALVKEGDIPVLFRHLPEMIALSEKLIQSFEDHASHLRRDMLPGQVGRIFRMLDQEFAVFVKYSVHYQANIKTIRRACTNVVFLKIEQESLTRRETNRMGISDYLIAPFQRVPRYCLLIKDLIKHSGRSGSQCADLDIALKMLTGLTVAMDHVQKSPR